MLGRGQRPLGCTTLITAEMDSILTSSLSREEVVWRRPCACKHELCGAAYPHRHRLGDEEITLCTRAQAACLNFVLAAARQAQDEHCNQAGCWGVETCGEIWAYAHRRWLPEWVPGFPTNLDTAQ